MIYIFFSWKKESIFTGRQRRSKWSLSTLCFGLLCARISSKVRVWQKPVWVHVARPKGHAQIYGHWSTFAQTFGLFKKILWPGQIYSPSQQLRHFWRIFCGQTVWVQSGPKKSQNLYGQTSICLKNYNRKKKSWKHHAEQKLPNKEKEQNCWWSTYQSLLPWNLHICQWNFVCDESNAKLFLKKQNSLFIIGFEKDTIEST